MTRKVLPILVLVLLGLMADSRAAFAEDCFINLRDCYERASREDWWGNMWLRGLDCEVTFVGCMRRAMWNG